MPSSDGVCPRCSGEKQYLDAAQNECVEACEQISVDGVCMSCVDAYPDNAFFNQMTGTCVSECPDGLTDTAGVCGKCEKYFDESNNRCVDECEFGVDSGDICQENSSDKKNNSGLVAAIVVPVVLVLVAASVVAVLLYRKRKQAKSAGKLTKSAKKAPFPKLQTSRTGSSSARSPAQSRLLEVKATGDVGNIENIIAKEPALCESGLTGPELLPGEQTGQNESNEHEEHKRHVRKPVR